MDPVMVGMFVAHHTRTLLPCNATSWVNVRFSAGLYLLFCKFMCPLGPKSFNVSKTSVGSISPVCDWWLVVENYSTGATSLSCCRHRQLDESAKFFV